MSVCWLKYATIFIVSKSDPRLLLYAANICNSSPSLYLGFTQKTWAGLGRGGIESKSQCDVRQGPSLVLVKLSSVNKGRRVTFEIL